LNAGSIARAVKSAVSPLLNFNFGQDRLADVIHLQEKAIRAKRYHLVGKIIWISFEPVADGATVSEQYGKVHGNSIQWMEQKGPYLAMGDGGEMILPFPVPELTGVPDPEWRVPISKTVDDLGNEHRAVDHDARAPLLPQSWLNVAQGRLIGRNGAELMISTPIHYMCAMRLDHMQRPTQSSAVQFTARPDRSGRYPVFAMDPKTRQGFIVCGQFF
jgi:hypothetical protein